MTYYPIADKLTYVISSGPAKLYGILVTSAGTGWTAKIYDGTNASGTTVADTFTLVAGLYNFGGVFLAGGLTIVTDGTTAGKLTVFYEGS